MPRVDLLTLLAATLACNSPAADPTSTTGGDESSTSGTQSTAPPDPTSSGEPATSTTGVVGTSTGDPDTSTSSTTTTGTATTADDTTTSSTGADTSTSSSTDDTSTSSETGDDTASSSTGSSETSSTDTGDSSTGTPDGLGVIAGDCGLIDAMELNSPDPFVFTGSIDFGMVGYDYDLLTPGGQQIYDEGNLNPGSLYSEIVAYEVLARCEDALLLKTENTIVYNNPMGKKTDLLVELDGLKVGVSVVRAVGFPQDDPYTPAQADTIMTKKLQDILASSANVAPEDKWVKQILSVVAYGPMHLDSVLTAYEALDPMIKADTIIVVTVTNGDDLFIY